MSNMSDDKRIMDRVDKIIYNPISHINNMNNNTSNINTSNSNTRYGNKFDLIRNTLR